MIRDRARRRGPRGVSVIEMVIVSFMTALLASIIGAIWMAFCLPALDVAARCQIVQEANLAASSLARDCGGYYCEPNYPRTPIGNPIPFSIYPSTLNDYRYNGCSFNPDGSLQINFQGSDLQLVSWGNGSGLPSSGVNLVIVGLDTKGLLNIGVFDAGANFSTTNETAIEAAFPSTQAAISALKIDPYVKNPPLPYSPLPYSPLLTSEYKLTVLTAVTSILVQANNIITPPQAPPVITYKLSGTQLVRSSDACQTWTTIATGLTAFGDATLPSDQGTAVQMTFQAQGRTSQSSSPNQNIVATYILVTPAADPAF